MPRHKRNLTTATSLKRQFVRDAPRLSGHTAENDSPIHSWLTQAKRLLPLVAIAALPVIFDWGIWSKVWTGMRPRAWDGTGHYALAQIYDQSIFPDTFGWTHAYFGGMPFPNFYPPLYYWLIAILRRTHLVSFTGSFKLVLVTSVLLLPVEGILRGRFRAGILEEEEIEPAVAVAVEHGASRADDLRQEVRPRRPGLVPELDAERVGDVGEPLGARRRNGRGAGAATRQQHQNDHASLQDAHLRASIVSEDHGRPRSDWCSIVATCLGCRKRIRARLAAA